MITNQKVRKLLTELQKGVPLSIAAARSGMSAKTARKYRYGKLPSECRVPHNWRTREDPFAGAWDKIETIFNNAPNIQTKAIFEHL